jgi:ribosomal protein S18 acetylase RimI-like enzyme
VVYLYVFSVEGQAIKAIIKIYSEFCKERSFMAVNNGEFKFRLAEQGDEVNILKLYRSIVGTEGCTWDEEYPSMLNILADIEMKSLYCVTDHSGEIIAAVAAGPFDELNDLIWDSRLKNPCELARIGVLPLFQRSGIASKLLGQVLQDCKRRGYDGMRFLVSKTNYNVLALYHKFGFQEVGEVFRYGHDFYCYNKVFNS